MLQQTFPFAQGVNRKQIRALYQVVLLLSCAAHSSPLQLHMSLKRNQRDCMCKGLQQMEDVSVPTAAVFVNKACFDVPVGAVWRRWLQSGNQTSCCYNDSPAGAAESNSSSICILCNYSIHLPKVNCQEQLIAPDCCFAEEYMLPTLYGLTMHCWQNMNQPYAQKICYFYALMKNRSQCTSLLFISDLSVPCERRNTRVTQRDTWYVEADSSGTRSLISQQTPQRLINMLGHTRTFVLHHRHWKTRMRRLQS